MSDKIEERLTQLRGELAKGEAVLLEIEEKRKVVNASLLRISGAIQVLEELLTEEHAIEREEGHHVNGAAPVKASVG
jgi:hypothetical protein